MQSTGCGTRPRAGHWGVSQAWFYKRHGETSLRRARRAALGALAAALFRRHRGIYGSPRITPGLHELGWHVSENTVAAMMAEQQLVARSHRRRRGTTRPGRSVAGAGPGWWGLRRRRAERALVGRRHRDRHRRRQAVSGQRARHRLRAPGRFLPNPPWSVWKITPATDPPPTAIAMHGAAWASSASWWAHRKPDAARGVRSSTWPVAKGSRPERPTRIGMCGAGMAPHPATCRAGAEVHPSARHDTACEVACSSLWAAIRRARLTAASR